MKTLHLLRHAKSSWDDPDLDDFDRPLNGRGEKDAPRMAKRLRKHGICPDVFYSSPAVRAITTAKIIADALHYPHAIIQQKELYHASESMLLNFLRNVPDTYQHVMIAGHNPGLTDFLNSLIAETIDNIPTCGFATIGFQIDLWKNVNRGKLMLFDYPKR